MKRKARLKKFIAFLLVFNLSLQSTSIAQGLVLSGLVQYLGGVGDRIVEYAKANYAWADEGDGSTESGDGSTESGGHGPDCNYTITYNCTCNYESAISSAVSSLTSAIASGDAATLAAANEHTDTAVGALTALIEQHDGDIKADLRKLNTTVKTEGKNVKDAIVALRGENLTTLADLLESIDSIGSMLGVPGMTPDEQTGTVLGILADIEDWGSDISQTLRETFEKLKEVEEDTSNINQVLSAMASSWFGIVPDINGDYSSTNPGGTGKKYNMFYLVDKIHESTTVLVPSLGYGTVADDGTYLPNEEGRIPSQDQQNNYIWTEMNQTSISADLSQLNHNLFSNFGYYQYELKHEDGTSFSLSEFNPSLAKDFGTLLSMFKNYHVAHVYSANYEKGAPWQPTPDEISYAKERVLNKGYANAYLGYWAVDTSDSHQGYSSRWEYILGKDILYPYEGYYIYISKNGEKQDNLSHVDGTEDNYSVNMSYSTSEAKNMKLTDNLNLSDMFRILYRAIGQDIVTVNAVGIPDKRIVAETSPTAQGLSNISYLYGDAVYVSAIRNNLMLYNSDGTYSYSNVYLAQAKRDGLIGNITTEQAEDYEVTWADVWYYASVMMDRYGEEVLNTTEIQSMLQLFGSNFPVQEGSIIADSWAYLMAKGCIAGNFNSSSNVLVEDFLDLAMRIADKDSRITYKNVQLVVALDEAVVDTGYFPVFNNNLQAVDKYNTSITYDYESSMYYDSYIRIEDIDATQWNFDVKYLLSTGEEKIIPTADNVSYTGDATTKRLRIRIPFETTDIAGLKITATSNSNTGTLDITIENKHLGGGLIEVIKDGDGKYISTSRTPFDDIGNSIYNMCVDMERAGRELVFAVPTASAGFIERCLHFCEYIFTPQKAYAFVFKPMETYYMSTVDGEYVLPNRPQGSSIYTYNTKLDFSSPRAAALLACFVPTTTQVDNWIKDSALKTVHEQTLKSYDANKDKSVSAVQMKDSAYNMWRSISLDLACKYYLALMDWSGTAALDFNGVSLTEATKAESEMYAYHTAIFNLFFEKLNAAKAVSTVPNLVTSVSVDTKNKQLSVSITSYSLKNKIKVENALNGKIESDGNALPANTGAESAAKLEEEIVQGSTSNGVGKITPASALYAEGIMHRDSTYFISYESLLSQKIVSTTKQPLPDENGILSFYLTNRGRVTIDTNNKLVMINSVLVKYGDNEPVFVTDDGRLFINYSCLVGINISGNGTNSESYTDSEGNAITEKKELHTVNGSGSNAVYQLATGIVAEEGVSATSVKYKHLENSVALSEKIYTLESYKVNSVAEDVKKSDYRIVLLSGVFPTGNWTIVDEFDGAQFAYVFYNRALLDGAYGRFDTGGSNPYDVTYSYYGITSRKAESGDVSIGSESLSDTLKASTIDSELSGYWLQEKSLLNNISIGGAPLVNSIQECYNMDAKTYPIIGATYYSLAKLAEATGILFENPDWLCRRFPVEYTATTTEMKVGKIYYLNNVGFVYTVPVVSDIVTQWMYEDSNILLKYAMGEYMLPYYYDVGRSEVVDYNCNTYVSSSGTLQYYGTTVVEDTSSTGSFKFEYIFGNPLEDSFSGMFDVTKNIIAAPAGIYRFLLYSEPVDSVRIGSVTRYSTDAAYFYYGTKQMKFVSQETDSTAFGITNKGGTLALISNADDAFVSTRDYYGRHHFILQPTFNPPSKVNIKPVDANSYITGYSDNPIYNSIKQWITDLDDTSTFILRIIFYFMPYVMLIWVLLLICIAVIPHHTVMSISKVIGIDFVSFLTFGRREVENWHGYKVTIPLFIAFVSIGLFYGPNLLRIIEIVSKWAYEISGLK